MGNLPLRGKKTADQSAAVYRAEYAQIIHHFSTLTRIDCEKFVRPMPTSLVHPEMVYPDKKYEAYCLKVPESGPVVQYEPISDYQMDGLQPRIYLRPGTKIPVYPEDEVDADPHFNEYLPYEEFVEGPDWTPGRILPNIHSLEYNGNTSDTSINTQAARTIQAVAVTADPEPARASLSQCFQKALATPRTKLAPPPEQLEGANKRGTSPVLTGRPICWNQPTPTRSPEGITLGSARPRQSSHAFGMATGGKEEKE